MLKLLRPDENLLASYLEFMEEMRSLGEKIWEQSVPYPEETNLQFIERLLRMETTPPPGLVPESHYWAHAENKIVGRISLRHRLNEHLKEFGGNIGYEVRPSSRNKGYATEMLRQVLETPKVREMGEVLLTCAPNNLPSNKTIIANGGVLVKTAFVERWQRDTNYYLIKII
jgi:predicted acetyltransferase